ncbi:hypothetical protein POVWA2_001200 [Plasmodium ovale wallikeri]|uniref:Uncharacterized protein n=1 Tax=Plasmodium ovale wallikeri TaxID=864142 RepID=A0A1A8YH78_PLAOA|nr:hypothetical protein POVWA2_001200 [Plasmodium ovale wallikeri]
MEAENCRGEHLGVPCSEKEHIEDAKPESELVKRSSSNSDDLKESKQESELVKRSSSNSDDLKDIRSESELVKRSSSNSDDLKDIRSESEHVEGSNSKSNDLKNDKKKKDKDPLIRSKKCEDEDCRKRRINLDSSKSKGIEKKTKKEITKGVNKSEKRKKKKKKIKKRNKNEKGSGKSKLAKNDNSDNGENGKNGDDSDKSTDLEEETYNDDNLFMDSKLRKKKGSNSNRNSGAKEAGGEPRREGKSKFKKIMCAVQQLELSAYNDNFEKQLYSYATIGLNKYNTFLKNYQSTQNRIIKEKTKKPKKLYV